MGSDKEKKRRFLDRLKTLAKKAADPTRAFFKLMMAGFATYLISVLMAIPVNALLGKLVTRPFSLSVASRTMLAVLSLDLPKGLSLMVIGFAIGRLVTERPILTAAGLTVSVYLYDGVVSHILDTFGRVWGNRYALAGRLPFLVVVALCTILLSLLGLRMRKRSEARKEVAGSSDSKDGQETSKLA